MGRTVSSGKKDKAAIEQEGQAFFHVYKLVAYEKGNFPSVFLVFYNENIKPKSQKHGNHHVKSWILDVTFILCILLSDCMYFSEVSKWADLISYTWPFAVMFKLYNFEKIYKWILKTGWSNEQKEH